MSVNAALELFINRVGLNRMRYSLYTPPHTQ